MRKYIKEIKEKLKEYFIEDSDFVWEIKGPDNVYFVIFDMGKINIKVLSEMSESEQYNFPILLLEAAQQFIPKNKKTIIYQIYKQFYAYTLLIVEDADWDKKVYYSTYLTGVPKTIEELKKYSAGEEIIYDDLQTD